MLDGFLALLRGGNNKVARNMGIYCPGQAFAYDVSMLCE